MRMMLNTFLRVFGCLFAFHHSVVRAPTLSKKKIVFDITHEKYGLSNENAVVWTEPKTLQEVIDDLYYVCVCVCVCVGGGGVGGGIGGQGNLIPSRFRRLRRSLPARTGESKCLPTVRESGYPTSRSHTL